MCITAHYIDSEWKLHKKIISFVPVTSHRGEYIAKSLENCLLEWGLKNIFTVTVDNASSNDNALGFFKQKLFSWGTSAVKIKYVHMRCIAHILNLVVNEGMKESGQLVKRVREVVRYIRNSPARFHKFREFADLIGVETKCSLSLDVPTRWNSTYVMLKTACLFDKVFEKYEECKHAFTVDLGDDVPDIVDWNSVKQLVAFLHHFFEMTLRISGSQYVTANSFFSKISDLYHILNEWKSDADPSKRAMAFSMKAKCDKYWGDPQKMNKLIFIGTVLDPRDKLEYMELILKHIYGDSVGGSLNCNVRAALYELFDDYCASSKPPPHSVAQSGHSSVATEGDNVKSGSLLKAKFKKQKMELRQCGSKKSELYIYLSEAVIEEDGTFDILRWWKINSERFPILSTLARDVLAVPISTVASESAFSTGGRVRDSFRSSLTPKIVEALICSTDWMKLSSSPVSIEESLDEVEQFEKGLCI